MLWCIKLLSGVTICCLQQCKLVTFTESTLSISAKTMKYPCKLDLMSIHCISLSDTFGTSTSGFMHCMYPPEKVDVWCGCGDLVGLMVLVSHFSRRFAKLLGNNPASILATLILLSFTKILCTLIITVLYITYLASESLWSVVIVIILVGQQAVPG